jgi:protein-disulfide isomerase
VQEHIDSGDHLGVNSTPTFFVNGERVDTSGGMQRLQQAIERVIAA